MTADHIFGDGCPCPNCQAYRAIMAQKRGRLAELTKTPPPGILILDPTEPPTLSEIEANMVDGIVTITTEKSIAKAVDKRWPLLHMTNIVTDPETQVSIIKRQPIFDRQFEPEARLPGLYPDLVRSKIDIVSPDHPSVTLTLPDAWRQAIEEGRELLSLEPVPGEDNLWNARWGPPRTEHEPFFKQPPPDFGDDNQDATG